MEAVRRGAERTFSTGASEGYKDDIANFSN
nr:hypothetical protein [Rickettsia bellii]